MPGVENSRVPGLFKLSVPERRAKIAELANLSEEHVAAWTGGLADDVADGLIENVVGTYALPIGIGCNFIIDGEHYLIPYVLEEPSVVAAASNIAKRCHATGGFTSTMTDPVMIGQIQVCRLAGDPEEAKAAVLAQKDKLIGMCNEVDPILVKFGGGCRDIEAKVLETKSGPMLIVHIKVDCRDAMGANAVNTMCESIGAEVGALAKGIVVLKIISNLAVHRLARVQAQFTPEEVSTKGDAAEGAQVIDGVLEAYHFALADPFRATTNNKGIMNAISPVSVATGQDWRAIEAGAHSYASYKTGTYAPLVEWTKNAAGNLVGAIELPMPVGLVGGASRVHPGARANIALLGIKTANDLGKVIGAAGIAQNLGALRALATVGIQQGHMKLHCKNLAVQAGAAPDEIAAVVDKVVSSGERITGSACAAALEALRDDKAKASAFDALKV